MALAGLDDQEFIDRSVRTARQGRDHLYQGLSKMGLAATPSHTNFILVDLGIPAGPVYEAMLAQGVIVRPLGPQGLPTCLRITVGTPDQNERALAALERALQVPVGG
jgi:histidinol-phosphate aminotransferase